MPKSVDDYLAKLTAKGMPKGEAIAIGKKQRRITQDGPHLAAGPTIGVHKFGRPKVSTKPIKPHRFSRSAVTGK